MDVSKERSRKGASRGNIHASARFLFSWKDTSTISVRRRGSKPSTLDMSNSSANSTLFSVKLTLSALTNSRRAAGAFASDRRRRTERWAGSSSRLRYNARSAIELKRRLTRSRGWRSKGQERNDIEWSMSSNGRDDDAVWPRTSMTGLAQRSHCCGRADSSNNPAQPPARSFALFSHQV